MRAVHRIARLGVNPSRSSHCMRAMNQTAVQTQDEEGAAGRRARASSRRLKLVRRRMQAREEWDMTWRPVLVAWRSRYAPGQWRVGAGVRMVHS